MNRRSYPLWRSFQVLLRAVRGDGMLTALLVAPLLLGAALRFGLPALIKAFPALGFLYRYPALWDALIYLITPSMALFASAMVTLEERDNGLCIALIATPLGKSGYFASRFVLPTLFAALYSALIGLCFCTVERSLLHTAALSLPASFTALAMIAFIPAYSRDQIAGMAMSKLCALPLLTVIVPFFLPYQWQPLLCWLPTYWFYRFLLFPDWLMLAMCLLVSVLWIIPSLRRLNRKALRG